MTQWKVEKMYFSPKYSGNEGKKHDNRLLEYC